jgi:hypothetical protein
MLLSAVLIGSFLAGCWFYCLGDAAFTPASEFPGLRKSIWVGIIAVTFIFGGAAWLLAHRAELSRRQEPRSTRHAKRPGGISGPVWRSGWSGPAAPVPADDPEFLELLSRRIRGISDFGELPAGSACPVGTELDLICLAISNCPRAYCAAPAAPARAVRRGGS